MVVPLRNCIPGVVLNRHFDRLEVPKFCLKNMNKNIKKMWTDTIRENQNIQNKIMTLFGTQVWENVILRRYGVISTDLTLWQNEFTKISQTYYYFKIIGVKVFEHSCEKLRFFYPSQVVFFDDSKPLSYRYRLLIQKWLYTMSCNEEMWI